MPRRARIPTSTLLWSAVVVAVAAFGLGFVMAYDSGTDTPTALAPPTSGSTTTSPPRPTRPPPTGAPTTTPSTTTTAPPATEPPPATVSTDPPLATTSTTVAVVTTTSTALVPSTTLPPTPGQIVVTYPQDDRGIMTIRAGGTAAIVVQNVGGSSISFTVNVVGPVTIEGATSAAGTLAPGEARNLGVTASPTKPPGDGPHASVAVFTALGLVVSIPVTIWAPSG